PCTLLDGVLDLYGFSLRGYVCRTRIVILWLCYIVRRSLYFSAAAHGAQLRDHLFCFATIYFQKQILERTWSHLNTDRTGCRYVSPYTEVSDHTGQGIIADTFSE